MRWVIINYPLSIIHYSDNPSGSSSHLPLHKGGMGAEEREARTIPPSRLAAPHLPLHKGGFGGRLGLAFIFAKIGKIEVEILGVV